MTTTPQSRRVFVTGSTGYLGRAVSAALLARGHDVTALCRPGSERRLATGSSPVFGDPLDARSYANALRHDHVVVHLVGTPKPAPWKAAAFERVDLGSVQQLATAVSLQPVAHVVYVSVAQPAPAMHAYVDARRRAELVLAGIKTPATILRPWYVLGPGHWWPVVLLPIYWAAEMIPSMADGANRLGLVTRAQMVSALVSAVESSGEDSRIWDVPSIRRLSP